MICENQLLPVKTRQTFPTFFDGKTIPDYGENRRDYKQRKRNGPPATSERRLRTDLSPNPGPAAFRLAIWRAAARPILSRRIHELKSLNEITNITYTSVS